MIGRFPAKKGCQEAVVELRKETKDDWWEVEALFDLCFAPGREALSSYRLRDDVAPISNLCLVARDTLGILEGAVRLGSLSRGSPCAFSLLPCIPRDRARLGGLLMNESLAQAKADDWERVMQLGITPIISGLGFQNWSMSPCHHRPIRTAFWDVLLSTGLGMGYRAPFRKIPFLRGAISYAVRDILYLQTFFIACAIGTGNCFEPFTQMNFCA